MLIKKDLDAKDNAQLDEEKLSQLYRGLMKYSCFLVKNRWEADDLVQEAVLKAIQKYNVSDLSPALLNKIAYHHWIDDIRKKKPEVIGFMDDQTAEASMFNDEALNNTVEHLMYNLTPKQAVIFVLKEAFHYQAKEIAELLSINETAVKSILYRAKKRLEKQTSLHTIDEYWDGNKRERLADYIYKAIQSEDPFELIQYFSAITSFAKSQKLTKRSHSVSPLNLYCMAA